MIRRGRAPRYVVGGGDLVISQKCIRNGQVDPGLARRTDSISKPVPDWAWVKPGDSLVNSTGRGTLGRAGLVRNAAVRATVDSHVTIVRPDTAVVHPGYLGVLLDSARQELEGMATGSTNQTELGGDAIGSLPLLIPPLDEQRRIVDLIAAVDEAVQAARAVALHARASLERALAQTVTGDGQQTVALGDVAAVDLDRVTVKPGHTYQIAGVLNAGQGLLKRDSIDGRATNYAALQRLRTNQLVMRKLTAWEGPITVVTEDFDGYFVSPEFPTFTLDKTRVVPGYVRHLCKSPILWAAMRDESTGSVQRRKRVSPQRLLTIHIPLPTILEQSRCAQRLSAFEAVQEAAAQVRTKAVALRSALLGNLLSGDYEIPASYDEVMG